MSELCYPVPLVVLNVLANPARCLICASQSPQMQSYLSLALMMALVCFLLPSTQATIDILVGSSLILSANQVNRIQDMG